MQGSQLHLLVIRRNLLEDELTDGGMAALHIGDEIGRLIFCNLELKWFASRGSDEQVSPRGNNDAGLHFSNHIATVRRDRPDGADLHQSLRTGRRLWMMKERQSQREMREKTAVFLDRTWRPLRNGLAFLMS